MRQVGQLTAPASDSPERVAQMKRSWQNKNRRELTWWENTYIPTLVSGLTLTSKHFFRNFALHLLHLVGIARDKKAAVTFEYPEKPPTAWLA